MRIRFIVIAAVAVLVAASVPLFLPSVRQAIRTAWPSGPGWEAVTTHVPTGKAVRLEVRLNGVAATPPVDGVRVTATRLDMAPDGMPTMTAPVRVLPPPRPGIVALEAELSMAGRWALSLVADVAGESSPVRGLVVFRAVDGLRQAPPPKSGPGQRRIVYYRNPMGAPDVSKTPKKDSMGMDYIPVYEDEVSDPPGTVRIAPEKVQRAGVRTNLVTRRALARTVRAYGVIAQDEQRQAVLTAKFDGFIEELLVPLTGTAVAPGQPLARIWVESREILQKQSDYVAALRGGRPADLERAAANLRQFDIPEAAFETLRRSGEPVRSLTLNAVTGGTVLERPALNGMRFTSGMTLFRIADLSVVWVMARVAERDLAAVAVGQAVRVMPNGASGAPITGRVGFVYPELDAATRTGMVRVELANPQGLLRIGQYADVEIETGGGQPTVVAVPDSAVIDSGARRVAFVVRGDGLFEARQLTLGRRGDGFVEVLAGLAEGERIVVTGNFLIDAESNLRAAISGLGAPQ
jgi:Cu(I)/Ag(I) efflux system membrane fusion protein